MKRSLRRRTIASGILSAVCALGLGWVMLHASFSRIMLTQFDRALANRQLQVVAALEEGGNGHSGIDKRLSDPAYDRPFSGIYWEVRGPDGAIQASRSLFDGLLPGPNSKNSGQMFYDANGPQGRVRIVEGTFTLSDGTLWTVMVGQSVNALREDQRMARASLLSALALIGVITIIGTVGQALAILRELGKLREEVLTRWRHEGEIEADRYPTEVRPLIEDINVLLHRNRDIIERTRRQGADLAHALKTPCSILQNKLEQWKAEGQDVSTAEAALMQVDAQIRRALARVQAVRSPDAVQIRSPVGRSVVRLIRLFEALPRERDIAITRLVSPHLQVAMDSVDLEEALGNLLDNACKWARSKVHVSALDFGTHIEIVIEDDGPGIPESDLDRVLQAGQRLDTASAGTGLGLAIASDLVTIYGGQIHLSRAPTLGGLRVIIDLPA